MTSVRGAMAVQLDAHGFVRIAGPHRTAHEAEEVARALVEACWLGYGPCPLSIIGDFVTPPLEGGKTRDFQTLQSRWYAGSTLCRFKDS
jgi:hypothetical protein